MFCISRQPEEVNLSEGKSVVLTEIEEGQEPESFWKTLGGKKPGYMSLIKGEGVFWFIFFQIVCLFRFLVCFCLIAC